MSLTVLGLILVGVLQSLSSNNGFHLNDLGKLKEAFSRLRFSTKHVLEKKIIRNEPWVILSGKASNQIATQPADDQVVLPPLQEAASPQKINPKLDGNFKPVLDELTRSDLEVIGELPAVMNGLIVRNGPNPIHPSRPHHWFDGDGMLHGIYIEDGKARYLNRFVQTKGYLLEKFLGFSVFGGLEAGLPFKNSANTAVIWHHQKLLAAWEGALPYSIRSSDLGTLGVETFGGKLSEAFTAHPKIDPLTGELLFFWIDQNLWKPQIRCGSLSREGVLSAPPLSIPLKNPVFMHDFAITKNYLIFMELPLVFDVWNAKLKYRPELGARIGVLPRTGAATDMRWFEVEPHYVFHTVNAYEVGDEVVLYGLAMQSPNLADDPSLYRWAFNLKSGAVDEGYINQRKIEFPVVNRHVVGQAFRYVYGTLIHEERGTALMKHDLETGASSILSFGEGRYGGETIFVPDPLKGSSEDDGWLVNIIYDESKDNSEIVIYDATDLDRAPVARILLPRRVPYGLHGTWIPKSELPDAE